jgi:hypothetical protein
MEAVREISETAMMMILSRMWSIYMELRSGAAGTRDPTRGPWQGLKE